MKVIRFEHFSCSDIPTWTLYLECGHEVMFRARDRSDTTCKPPASYNCEKCGNQQTKPMEAKLGDVLDFEGERLICVKVTDSGSAWARKRSGCKFDEDGTYHSNGPIEHLSRLPSLPRVERLGESGMRAWFASDNNKEDMKKPLMVGDELLYEGFMRYVVAIEGKKAVLCERDAKTYLSAECDMEHGYLSVEPMIKCPVMLNEITFGKHFVRHGEQNILVLLAANAVTAQEAETIIGAKKEKVMATKKLTEEQKAANKAARDAAKASLKNKETKPTEKKSKKIAKTDKSAKAKGGSLGDIFGFAVTAVLRRLGKEGVTTEQAGKILEKRGITMPRASMSVQVGYGRSGTRPPAELTKAQVEELKAQAE